MKLIRLATIAILSSSMFAGGMAAFAEEAREVTTNGQIEFVANEDEELEVVPPVTDPDVEITPEVPGTTGPLSIMKVATMNFGSQVISNQDKTYSMVAEMQNLADGAGQVPYISFAQVQDVRGTNEGWDLQVSLSDFTSATQNNVLIGSEIEFVDSYIQYEGSNQENAPTAHANGIKLIPNAGAVSVMKATKGQGAGVSSVVWGNQDDLNTQVTTEGSNVVTNNAIQLSIPGSTAKDATTYTSTLNWELTSTPGEDA